MSPSYHVYVLSTQSPDVDATKPILYATVLVLLVLTFTLNIVGGGRAGAHAPAHRAGDRVTADGNGEAPSRRPS